MDTFIIAVCNLVKEKQRFFECAIQKYSTLTQEKVFPDTFSTTSLAVSEEFESAEALSNMDLQELAASIIKSGKNRFPDSDAVAKVIQQAARSSYHLPKTVNDSANQVHSISITSIKAFESSGQRVRQSNCCENHTLLAKYAGLVWTQYQSDNFEVQNTRLINTKTDFLKYHLCEVVFSLVRCNKEYKDFYHFKY